MLIETMLLIEENKNYLEGRTFERSNDNSGCKSRSDKPG